jgi:hypothetical protein
MSNYLTSFDPATATPENKAINAAAVAAYAAKNAAAAAFHAAEDEYTAAYAKYVRADRVEVSSVVAAAYYESQAAYDRREAARREYRNLCK